MLKLWKNLGKSEALNNSVTQILNDPDESMRVTAEGEFIQPRVKTGSFTGMMTATAVVGLIAYAEHAFVNNNNRFAADVAGSDKPTSAQLASGNRTHIEADTVFVSVNENLTTEVKQQIQEIYNRATHAGDFAGEIRIEGHTDSYSTEKGIAREFAKLHESDQQHSETMHAVAGLHHGVDQAGRHYVVIKHLHYNL